MESNRDGEDGARCLSWVRVANGVHYSITFQALEAPALVVGRFLVVRYGRHQQHMYAVLARAGHAVAGTLTPIPAHAVETPPQPYFRSVLFVIVTLDSSVSPRADDKLFAKCRLIVHEPFKSLVQIVLSEADPS